MENDNFIKELTCIIDGKEVKLNKETEGAIVLIFTGDNNIILNDINPGVVLIDQIINTMRGYADMIEYSVKNKIPMRAAAAEVFGKSFMKGIYKNE